MDHEEMQQDQAQEINPSAPEQHGFQPLPEEAPTQEKPRETPEMKVLKDRINALICRYPELTLRSSAATMASLEQYDEAELKNIMQNCITDLQKIRGVPAAEFVLHLVCGLIDYKLLPGYLDRCMDDQELKRDVESEMMSWIGVLNTRLNIVFRMLNNAYIQAFQPDYPHYGEYDELEEKESQYMRNVIPQDEQQEERPHKRARPSSGENTSSH